MPRKLLFVTLLISFTGLLSCKTTQTTTPSGATAGMFKVSVLYPNSDGKTFDMDYYEKKHMPMVAGFLGNNLKFYEIDKAISGRTPDEQLPYLAVGHFYVSDVAEYRKAIGQNINAILADFKNYTNIQPVVLISEIKQVVHNSTK
jgi:uncharacterized protein (TIGR02118 family)